MRKTLQRRPSSRSSNTEYSSTDSTPFRRRSVLFGFGRSSGKRGKRERGKEREKERERERESMGEREREKEGDREKERRRTEE